jgi:hypothetical protein
LTPTRMMGGGGKGPGGAVAAQPCVGYERCVHTAVLLKAAAKTALLTYSCRGTNRQGGVPLRGVVGGHDQDQPTQSARSHHACPPPPAAPCLCATSRRPLHRTQVPRAELDAQVASATVLGSGAFGSVIQDPTAPGCALKLSAINTYQSVTSLCNAAGMTEEVCGHPLMVVPTVRQRPALRPAPLRRLPPPVPRRRHQPLWPSQPAASCATPKARPLCVALPHRPCLTTPVRPCVLPRSACASWWTLWP